MSKGAHDCGAPVTQLDIDELLPFVMAAGHLDPERVERYAKILDALPPVIAFETEAGIVLADGCHRVAAAKRAGRMTIAADLRRGSRREALRYAAEIVAAQRGISVQEAIEHIRRRSKGI